MLTSLHIKNFRGFKDLSIESFKRVNLIIGQNNTGKTGLLEALCVLLQSDQSFHTLPQIFRTTGRDLKSNFWDWLFFNKNTAVAAVVTGRNDGGAEFGVSLKEGIPVSRSAEGICGLKVAVFSTNPTSPTQDAIDYNRVVVRRKRKNVEALLKKVEPRLEAVEALQIGREPVLYVDIGLPEMIPVSQMGQGFNRLLDIYSEIFAAEARVLLIDEIENGIHHSVMPTIWAGLFHAAQEVGVQIFATTHSWECVLAADQAAREQEPYGLNLIRLDHVDDTVKATMIDQEGLGTAKELHWEMR